MSPSDIIEALEQEKILFDKAVVGHGYRRPNGSVKITNALGEGLHKLEQTFINSYPAGDDIIGQIFAAYPSLVQMVSPAMLNPKLAPTPFADNVEEGDQARAVRGQSKLRGESLHGLKERVFLADYLDNEGIGWLMIVGASFSGRLYWVTLYRNKGASSFNDADKELFQYLVPILLLRFHRARAGATSDIKISQSGIPQLSPYHLRLALLMIEGNTHHQASIALGITPHTVKSYLKAIRAQLKIPREGKLTLDVIYRGVYDKPTAMAKNKLAE